MNHSLRTLGGCALPLLLICGLPLLGGDEGITLFIFIILMFGSHILMMTGHRHHGLAEHSAT